ncbi:MAG: virB10 protein [Rickettsiaceae bacterium]|jgi:type IV secretion system protein VirB10|nr:virB10 protein [Rickettsiaceae bacterium]
MAEEKNKKIEHVVEPEVSNELSQVATNPAKSMALVGIIGVIFVAIFYNLFLAKPKNEEPKPETPRPIESQIVKPNADVADLPEVPALPEPKLVEPTPPPPLPAPVEPPPVALPQPALPTEAPPTKVATDGILTGPSEEEKRRREMKRKSPIIVKDGGVPPKPPVTSVVKMQSLEYTLGRGKIIDAVLESAVNTDFGGEIRALISRDIYSESGRVILIPKGSRIFGNYSAGIGSINGRVEITWDRIDLASGYRLTLNALAIDNLGRKGVAGRVDNKYREKITNAVLISAFNILAARGIDKLVKPVASTQTAATSQAAATAITTAATNAALAPGATYATVCTAIQNAITDKTSTAYNQSVSECTRIAGSGGTAQQMLQEATTLGSTIATSLASTAAENTTPTKAQKAAEDSYKDVTETFKDILKQETPEPTISIDQGKPIKIYVTKDYEFPKEAVFKSRLVK